MDFPRGLIRSNMVIPMPPPPRPKNPAGGASPWGEEEATQVHPRRLTVPQPGVRPPPKAGSGSFDAFDVPTTPSMPAYRGANLQGGGNTQPGTQTFSGVAREVSQGLYRELAHTPRGVLSRADLIKGLQAAIQKVLQPGVPVVAARTQLKAEWLPLLRQAVEQAGGDGLDTYITQLLDPPGIQAKSPLVPELASRMERLEAATSLDALGTVAKDVCTLVDKALGVPILHGASLKLMERELDGRVDVGTLLSIRFAGTAELEARRSQTERAVESLRQQMRALPGKHPDGLFANLARLKVEKRLMDAEARRRTGP
jgi:hypothetical protein